MTELDVRNALAVGILSYKDQNPGVRSFKFISERTKVAESFIKRVAKADDSVSLDAEKFLSLARLVLADEKRKVVVNYFYNRFFQYHFDDLGGDPDRDQICKNERTVTSKKFEEVVVNDDTLLVYNLACQDNGVSLEEVESMGEFHVNGLKKLVRSGVVFKKDDNFHAIKKNWTVSAELTRKKLEIYSRCYKYENFGKKRNYFFNYSFGLSQEGIEVFQQKMRDFSKEIRSIREQYMGSRQIICTGFFDSINNYHYEKEEKQKNLKGAILGIIFLVSTMLSSNSYANYEDYMILCAKTASSDTRACLTNYRDNGKFEAIRYQDSALEAKKQDSIGKPFYFDVIKNESSSDLLFQPKIYEVFKDALILSEQETSELTNFSLVSCSTKKDLCEKVIKSTKDIKPILEKFKLDRHYKGGESGTGG